MLVFSHQNWMVFLLPELHHRGVYNIEFSVSKLKMQTHHDDHDDDNDDDKHEDQDQDDDDDDDDDDDHDYQPGSSKGCLHGW